MSDRKSQNESNDIDNSKSELSISLSNKELMQLSLKAHKLDKSLDETLEAILKENIDN